MSGDELTVKGGYCYDKSGQAVLGFSKLFIEKMAALKKKGFEVKSVKVGFVVFWKKEGREDEVKVFLPEVVFGRERNFRLN